MGKRGYREYVGKWLWVVIKAVFHLLKEFGSPTFQSEELGSIEVVLMKIEVPLPLDRNIFRVQLQRNIIVFQ